MQDAYTTFTESLLTSYNNFLKQLPDIGMAILIVVVGVLIANWLSSFARKRITAETKDPLMSSFLGKSIKSIIIAIAIILALKAAGLGGIATGIFTAAGASAVVLGFAFKDIGENFIAGIILAFNRPFDVNDTVEIGEVFGKVKTLEFRYTKLKTFDGKDVYIPNSDVLTKPVTNFTEDGFYRWNFTVGIAYEDDIKGAKESIMRALKNEPDVVEDAEHENFVIEDELGTSTVNLKIFFWVDTHDFRRAALITKGDVIRGVKEALEKDGYYLPADIQEIKLYGKEKDFPMRMFNDSSESEKALPANQ